MATLLDPLTTTSPSSPQNLRRPLRFPPSAAGFTVSRWVSFSPLSIKRSPPKNVLVSLGATRRAISIVCDASETDVNGSVPSVTSDAWESLVLKADCPVVVEFWAPWCGPCRMLHPVVGELSKQYVGRVRCFQLNTDDHPSIATQYGIRSIPTIMIFVNGEKKDAIIGAVPKTTLAGSLEKYL